MRCYKGLGYVIQPHVYNEMYKVKFEDVINILFPGNTVAQKPLTLVTGGAHSGKITKSIEKEQESNF